MNNEIEYIEPTQEHVGQMVEVSVGEVWHSRELLGVVKARQRFVTEEGTTTVGWDYARIPRPLTYAERQAKCGLKVGDRVKFVRKFKHAENGYKLEWFDDLNNYLGHVGTIGNIEGEEGGRGGNIFVSGMPYVLPYFVLEKVEDRVATRRDFNKTVYIDGNPQDEFEIEFIYEVPKEPWRAVVVKNDKRFVYELSNLRVIE